MSTTRTEKGGVAVLTIDRPEARNAINRDVADGIHAALTDYAENDEIRCLIITGSGEKVFVSGADIRELQKKDVKDGFEAVNSRLFTAVERFPKPVIAAVNGFALGGGCELALACDLRVASPNARFGFPETGLGIMPAAGATFRLPRIVGIGRAKELIFTGDIIDAARALEIGLVNAIADNALVGAGAMAAKILKKAPLATRMAKSGLNLQPGTDEAIRFEIAAQTVLYGTKDKLEGMTAFLEKRKPDFTGE
ncbi:MAG: enoyl-CoA hydratase-related protein [Nitrospinota bacterium]|jgi:enoyl-CoA hydratase|nr:enoyl-CoA hydratase-related protein [Nitrospinota bacterium]